MYRSKKLTIQEYDKSLKHKDQLAPSIVSILQSQKGEIQSTVNEISTLEDVVHEQHL